MKLSGQLRAPATFVSHKEPSLHLEKCAVWTLEAVWLV
jgi:hypothetical protein